MHQSTIVKSLSLAGAVLSLMSVGVPSASAAVDAQAPLATETHIAGNRTSNRKTDQPAPVLSIQSHPAMSKMTEQIATYGNVNNTLIKLVGTNNTRDIGGYETTNVQWQIRHNRLMRSDNLNKINNSNKKFFLLTTT